MPGKYTTSIYETFLIFCFIRHFIEKVLFKMFSARQHLTAKRLKGFKHVYVQTILTNDVAKESIFHFIDDVTKAGQSY